MPSAEFLVVMLAAALIAVIASPLLRRLRLTLPVALVIFGFVGSEALVGVGHDTGLRWPVVADITFLLLIPLVIFDAAFRLRWQPVRQQVGAIALLTGPLWLLALVVTAVLIYFGINHPAGFPWIAALLAACIVTAIDPAPLFDHISARDQVTLEGETLGSDTAALVAFAVLVEVAQGAMVSFGDGAALLAAALLGGAAIGMVMGGLLWTLAFLVSDRTTRSVGTLCLIYLGYILAERQFDVSGVIALVPAAIIARLSEQRFPTGAATTAEETWRLFSFAASVVLFLLLGATVTIEMFQERWYAMAIGVGAVLVSRGVVAFCIPRTWLPPGGRLLIFSGGLRGTVVVALALILPTELPYWWTIQSIAYGVVLFTLFVQLPLAVTVFAPRTGLIK